MATIHTDNGRTSGPKLASPDAETASQTAETPADILKDVAVEALEEARRLVRENPVAAVAVGVGIGFLIGAWLRRD